MVGLFSLFMNLIILLRSIAGYNVDPSDFFLGAQHRPRLEIITPENGEILDDVNLEIKIRMKGYDLPSSFHDSKVCIGLSTGVDVAEQCFEQTADLSFHVNGLNPGSQYTLRVAFYERGKAIAVSVRNFKVAGIEGLVEGDVVSIQTAVQVAMHYQTSSRMNEAESIYRSILYENPAHADALHLLGIVFYQRGDPQSAVPLIEKALTGNKTYEGFHNSLGLLITSIHTSMLIMPLPPMSQVNAIGLSVAPRRPSFSSRKPWPSTPTTPLLSSTWASLYKN